MAATTTEPSLLALNDDVLYLICCHLPRVTPLSSTCRRLRNVAAPLFWRRMAVSEGGKANDRRSSLGELLPVLRTSPACARFTRQLSIVTSVFDEVSPSEATSLVAAVVRLEHLRYLQITVCKGSGHVAAAFGGTQCPSVSTLALCAELRDTIPSFPNVRHLRLERHVLSYIPTSKLFAWTRRAPFPHLRHLEIREDIAADGLSSILAHINACLPHLQYLGTFAYRDVPAWFSPRGDEFAALASFRHLRAIAVSISPRAGDAGMAALPVPDPRLTHGRRPVAYGHVPIPAVQCPVLRAEARREELARQLGSSAFASCASLEEVWVDRADSPGGKKEAEVTASLLSRRRAGEHGLGGDGLVWTQYAERDNAFAW